MQKKKRLLLLILFSLCVMLVVTSAAAFFQNRQTPVKETGLEDTKLPPDFHLAFTWGECSSTAARTALEIDEQGNLYAALVDDSGQSGVEATRYLNQAERRHLIDALTQADVMTLPEQITSSDDVISLAPGCSQLVITQDGKSKTIDEANGINARYYALKVFLESLTVAP